MTIDLETDAGKQEVLRIALDAAREAGALILSGLGKRTAARHKGAVDLVTRYDFESEKLLRRRLGDATPFAFVGEEEGGRRAEGDDAPTWYVDPIDGTTNFVHGHPFFCVSVGLVVGTRPLAGVVVAPALGHEWVGARGLGATRDGDRCAVSDVDAFGDAFLATGFPYDRRTSTDDNLDAFVALKKQAQAIRRCGSAAIDLCMVADGTYDGYWERKLKVWDLAAGAAIVLAAGGTLSSFDGGPDDVTRGQLVATNGAIHGALIAALGALPSTRDASRGWSGT